jgi:hypothetical protein
MCGDGDVMMTVMGIVTSGDGCGDILEVAVVAVTNNELEQIQVAAPIIRGHLVLDRARIS